MTETTHAGTRHRAGPFYLGETLILPGVEKLYKPWPLHIINSRRHAATSDRAKNLRHGCLPLFLRFKTQTTRRLIARVAG